ncbi:lytic transglycosylase domain-containing protein [Streptomyces phyllanthi]|uniref:Lytic transglycosylase domain-containing protein n=1 Tax=Streptomyces phyllanthi TaxID=1803180 RepID=A0A5N8W8D8_9ACTN|nr:lytic transglycosylase domain-containing protein [Streptomyces phyllanthi]MPY43382.1 lytic transglycosylase domain-containing protein [Streptomyces phyllanthi]
MSAQFGKRLRKGAANTAVAAVVVAALAASQAPGVTTDGAGRQTTGSPSPDATPDVDTATGNSRYYTDLPPLESPIPSPGTGDTSSATGEAERGIPATVLDAYKKAEASLRESKPGCNLPWQLLAAIGKVESGQARGGRVDADGTTFSKILGPQLSGGAFATISDTDNGAYDGDSSYDRAVGPMQFIPSTWEWAGRDGNDDGRKDPNNIYDAALAAGHYLCRFDWDLSDQGNLRSAILSYNNSTHYYNTVLSWLEYYRKGTHEVPDGTGTLPTTPSDRGNSGSGTSPSPSPGDTKKPTTPKDPAKPGNPGTGGGSGGGSGGSDPSTPPKPPSTPPTPTETVDHLEDAGTGTLTATAGDAFAEKVAVRTETESGKAVARVRVRFTIVGDTDATFAGGETVATVMTGTTGTATAPALQAGEKTGDFKVRATVVGRSLPGLDFKATVTARQADALARTSTTALTCVPGGEFAELVEVKATYKGEVADGVAATATLVKSAEDPAANDKGPYFKGTDDKPVRTLTGLTTDKDGLLKLPRLYADDTTGDFLLRVTTTGGATITVDLKVAAAETASPTPTTS